MFCMVFHSCVRLSFVSGNVSILLDVITVSCEFVFYRVIREVVDGDVSGSGFSVDVNFQFICFPNNT